jgi:ribosomal protein S12 methylthiotransferase
MEASRVKVGLVNLGCPKNQVDSEIMLGTLKQHGFELTDDLGKARVVVINTCGFIDAAKQESINTIIEYGKLKTQGDCEVLIAAGCLAQRYPEELMTELPELDGVVGTGDFPKIAEICDRVLGEKGHHRRTHRWTETPTALYGAETPRIRLSPQHWAYVKISEGCNYRCSFCAIPSFRGDLVSRPEADIVSEVRTLAAEGVKEINLIAQSLTSYGWDRRDKTALIRLLKELVGVDGIGWIRLYYTYPTDLNDELLDLMASEPRIANYVDIPLQHINDTVLRRMNRKGDSRLIRNLLHRIREKVPGAAIRSTFIVGFPGETEKAFEELCSFVLEAQFDRIGVFTYSHEDGTSAFALKDNIPAKVKAARQAQLLNLQSEISLAKNQARMGTVQTVLVDGMSPETGQLEGRLEGQAPEIDGVVILEQRANASVGRREAPSGSASGGGMVAPPMIEGDAKPGEFVKVEITSATDSDLFGRIIAT